MRHDKGHIACVGLIPKNIWSQRASQFLKECDARFRLKPNRDTSWIVRMGRLYRSIESAGKYVQMTKKRKTPADSVKKIPTTRYKSFYRKNQGCGCSLCDLPLHFVQFFARTKKSTPTTQQTKTAATTLKQGQQGPFAARNKSSRTRWALHKFWITLYTHLF